MLTIPSVRADLITRRTYNRQKSDGIYENWSETVARTIEHQKWLWERALKRDLNKLEKIELEQLRELIENRKALVAGRTLWLGGTEISKKRESSQFNCLSGDTEVLTKNGVFPICELVGKQTLLNGNGKWVEAEVKNFGVQSLYTLSFRRGHRTHYEVRATENHNWHLSDGRIVQTKNLMFGDTIKAVKAHKEIENNIDYTEGLQHGIVYGDGTTDSHGNFRVRLCGKSRELLSYFPGWPFSYPPSFDGDPIVYLKQSALSYNLKKLPVNPSNSYLLGFLRGWFAADGSVSLSGQSYICCDELEANWISLNAPRVGWGVGSFYLLPKETNFGLRKKASGKLGFFADTLCKDDMILSYKKDRISEKQESYFTYLGCEKDGAEEEVYCAVVPETHNFVLGNGLLTGNCAFLIVENVFDIVDAYHLLLQGCGVGFRTRVGSLYGFPTKIPEIAIIRSNRTAKGGRDSNHEYYDKDTKVWTIQIGDSSDAWAKAAGKVVAGKYPGCKRLVLDFSQVRPAGTKLSGYGWLSCGDELISKAFVEIFNLLNDACSQQGQMLTHQQIHDIMNLLGTTLSNRRSAEISLFYYGTDGWEEFATCKSTLFERDSEGTILKDDNGWFKQGKHWWRDQSNNTVLHTKKPSKAELVYQFELMRMSGGSEPGIGNEEAAKKRAPWFSGFNPCVEILLANRGFCNLVTVNLSHKDHKDFHNLLTTIHLISRANYRQTLVNLDDGILHRGWHENNQMLRLCGVSLCGVVQRKDLTEDNYKEMRFNARNGATSMAQELGLQIPKNITCIKPEGTAAKVLGTLEQEVTSGVHQAIGRYEFNTVNFGVHEPIVKLAREANYLVREHPTNPANVLITFPVFNGEDVPLLNNETALDQLNRYKMLMANWCDQNVSCTVYYSVNEVPKIIDWLLENWDNYVGVSFLYRQLGAELGEPEEVACKRLGYAYLPQRAVSKEEFETYTSKLKPIDLSKMDNSGELIKDLVDCSTGACPVR